MNRRSFFSALVVLPLVAPAVVAAAIARADERETARRMIFILLAAEYLRPEHWVRIGGGKIYNPKLDVLYRRFERSKDAA